MQLLKHNLLSLLTNIALFIKKTIIKYVFIPQTVIHKDFRLIAAYMILDYDNV